MGDQEGPLDPDLAYGPDDPGYGPPGPDWYRQDSPEAETSGSGPELNAADDLKTVRSPFEPLVRSTGPSGGGAAELPVTESELSAFAAVSYEQPDVGDVDLSGLEGDPLSQLHGLYSVAEAVSDGVPARQFDQLLERQRKLISEYFRGPAGSAPSAQPGRAGTAGVSDGDALVGSGGEPRGTR